MSGEFESIYDVSRDTTPCAISYGVPMTGLLTALGIARGTFTEGAGSEGRPKGLRLVPTILAGFLLGTGEGQPRDRRIVGMLPGTACWRARRLPGLARPVCLRGAREHVGRTGLVTILWLLHVPRKVPAERNDNTNSG